MTLGLTGCSDPVTEPSSHETWPPPVESVSVEWLPAFPQDELNTDPWAAALREHRYQTALAWNAHNFTSRDLFFTTTTRILAAEAKAAELATENAEGYPVQLGPLPFTVVNIAQSDEGTEAVLTVCEYARWEATYSGGESTPQVIGATYTLRRESPTDRAAYVVGSSRSTPDLPDCTGAKVAEARFAPAPVPKPPGTYAPSDIIVLPSAET